MPKKILLIAYAFPPAAAPEAYLAAKTVGNIPDTEVDVLCADSAPYFLPTDAEFLPYTQSRFRRIFRVPHSPLLRWIYKKKHLSSGFAALSLFPDRAVYLQKKAWSILKDMDLSTYDALLTWSQFHSSHLLGLQIKKKYPQLRWLAHFSDPWVDNPFNRFTFVTTPLYKRLESNVLRSADKLLFTSKETVDLVLKKYPVEMRQKVAVVPHPFDPHLYGKAPKASSQIIFRYLGNFYGPRTPLPLLRVLKKLSEKPALLENVKFEFIGSFKRSPWLKLAAELKSWVSLKSSVSYLESLKLMQEAQVLMVIDAPALESVFLPSKLVDYLGAQKFIFGITPPGASAQLIEKAGGKVANPKDLAAIEKNLCEILSDLRAQKSLSLRAPICNAYNTQNTGIQMAQLLD